MARKATHYGICQICGSEQLLPGGTLSLHGYHVQWNTFTGTCSGSSHLPFEQSKDLIENAIERATARAKGLREQVQRLRTEATDKVWVVEHVYIGRQSHYLWSQVEMELTHEHKDYGDGHTAEWWTTAYTDRNGRRHQTMPYNHSAALQRATTRDEAVIVLNGGYAHSLEGEANQLDTYVAWQRERVAHWAPKDLKPRAEKA